MFQSRVLARESENQTQRSSTNRGYWNANRKQDRVFKYQSRVLVREVGKKNKASCSNQEYWRVNRRTRPSVQVPIGGIGTRIENKTGSLSTNQEYWCVKREKSLLFMLQLRVLELEGGQKIQVRVPIKGIGTGREKACFESLSRINEKSERA